MLDAFETAGIAEHDGGRREIGGMANFVDGPPSVVCGDDRAGAHHRPEQHRVVGAIRREDRDAVALLYAVALTQRRRDRCRSSQVVGERERLFTQREVAGVAEPSRRQQHLAQVAVTLREDGEAHAEHVVVDHGERRAGRGQLCKSTRPRVHG